MTFTDIENTFKSVGGEFVSSPILISKKLKKIKALVFDWDGVFNDGVKASGEGSPFSTLSQLIIQAGKRTAITKLFYCGEN